MCGIIACIKTKGLFKYLVDGLKLEDYRGYDSCGIGFLHDNKLNSIKAVGAIDNLNALLPDYQPTIGIGHTRWATHGKNSVENAHPHTSNHGLFSLVHNGTIYNYKEIKKELESIGFTFNSQTDSEVIVNLLEYEYGITLDVKEAIENVISRLEGTFALCILFCYENKIYFAKNHSPLIIGLGNDYYSILSDINALQNETEYIYINDLEYGFISKDSVQIYKDGKKVKTQIEQKETDLEQDKKSKYSYYMKKEIDEIPMMINNLVEQIQKEDLNMVLSHITKAKKLVFIASGTSYHAALIAQDFFNKEKEVIIASELYTSDYKVDADNYYIFISQSGETMDVLKSLEYINKTSSNTLGITNVKNSSLYKLANQHLLIHAKKEIAVASTKAYINEVLLLYIISCKLYDKDFVFNYKNYQVSQQRIEEIKEIALSLKDKQNALFIGKGKDYYLALEASLKLKEVSYIHSEALYSGELKHGPIALIEKGFPVFVIKDIKENEYLLSACEEITSREGQIYSFYYDHQDKLSFIKMMCEFFYLAFYTAKYKEKPIDKPRNLAKSVTVE